MVEGRTLGLDVGDRWIGVALSDPLGILASPLTRIERTDDEAAVKAIADLVAKHEAKAVVAGLPYTMSGSLGPQAVSVQDFLRKLAESLSVPIQTSDERLSTVTAMQGMIEAGASRESRKGKIDAAAAALILQWYLDRLRREQAESQDTGPSVDAG
ncbi:MAG TPA: Holliday junction resolvase RuvX [Dehalococcoidia bacterium]|nr:Holliday junction resolvase RuvX [Dehalococcoidia bacterium]